MIKDDATYPPLFPESWAQSYGQDAYGFWQGIYVGDIEHRFRWIPPGQFLMGSPEDEPERLENEGPQQQIHFDQGFWLAETACTQAFWQAVIGKNPSRFQDDLQNPVENVAWNDAQKFVSALNALNPELDFRLPSEAEWEYACRAGTTTPFWFGSELSTEDANHADYQGKTGEFRQKTLPVKSFKANPWGLYQMHGNVWEWCEDIWHSSHQGANPHGRPRVKGDSKEHVARGGSWNSRGGILRAAYRLLWHLGSVNSGFRLARGSKSSSQAEADAALRLLRGTSNAASMQQRRGEH